MSGGFPGADGVDEFWENLCCGRERVRRFTEEELLEAGVPAETVRDPNYVKVYYLL